MSWSLEIHMIDVGQGESSLIVARHTDGTTRAMLVDAGRAGYAKTVHGRVARFVKAVDNIVVSHYDLDHAGGMVGLLSAEIMWEIADHLGQTVAKAADWPGVRDDYVQEVIYAVAAWLAMYGLENQLEEIANGIKEDPPIRQKYPDPTRAAQQITSRVLGGGDALVKQKNLSNAALAASFSAATARSVTGDTIAAAVRDAVVAVLYPSGDTNGRFNTHGLYEGAAVVDLGKGALLAPAAEYLNAVGGNSKTTSGSAHRPGGGFMRVYPRLGQEILGGTGPPAKDKKGDDERAPKVYVVARKRELWPDPDHVVGGLGVDANLDSIALLVRFNKFFFWTAGDLPSLGEDLLADRLTNRGETGVPFVPVDALAAFKCGHHGADGSTSDHFLDTMNPAVALISVGRGYDHPHAHLIGRLERSPMVYGYLTNCSAGRNGIPASLDQDQLDDPDTKFFVAGEPSDDNLAADRVRGDVHVNVTEDASNRKSDDEHRAMTVSFFDTTSGPSRRVVETVRF